MLVKKHLILLLAQEPSGKNLQKKKNRINGSFKESIELTLEKEKEVELFLRRAFLKLNIKPSPYISSKKR